MFKFFSKPKAIISPTGVYIIEGETLKPLNELTGTLSINNITESLGYKLDQVHVALISSQKITCIVFKKYSKTPIFVLAKEKTIVLSYSDIIDEIKRIDWEFEWKQLKWEDNNPNIIAPKAPEDAQQNHLTFKDIPIDGNIASFAEKLTEYGYEQQSYDNHCIALKGKFAGIDSNIYLYATCTTETIHTVSVAFDEPYVSWMAIKGVYEKIQDAYTQKYGTPTMESHHFEYPYQEGDGNEMTALKNNKCYYSSIYETHNGSITLGMCTLNDNCKIFISYTDKINAELKSNETRNEILEDI